MARITRYQPQPVMLADNSPVTREFHDNRTHLPGHAELQAKEYANYETHTVFNDIFLDASGENVCALGPPLVNLTKVLLPIEVSVTTSASLQSPILKHQLKDHDRVTFHKFPLPSQFAGHDVLTISVKLANGQTTQIESRRSNLDKIRLQFVTLQKNNPHPWILDWIRYHHALGVQRVLFYDNGSDDSTGLLNSLQAAPDDLDIVLIDWPFAYGPATSHYNQFCQASQNNHAYQYFGAAQWTGHFDIDEYLVFKQGNMQTLLDNTRGLKGQLRFDSYWMPNITSTPLDHLPTIRSFHYRERNARGTSRKYIARNDRIRMANTHKAVMKFPWQRSTVSPEKQVFFHYKPLTTNWKIHANRHQQDELNADLHIEDLDVISTLDVATEG